MSDKYQPGALRRSSRLIRHAAIRRTLMGRYHHNGIRSVRQLQAELKDTMNLHVSLNVLSTDLREMGATKVTDLLSKPQVSWWMIPSFNPNVEDLRSSMDPSIIENEVGVRIGSHAVDVTPVGRMVYVLTEARAGGIVAYWASWLSWPEIILVMENPDAAVIHCHSHDGALAVAERLVGYRDPVNIPESSTGGLLATLPTPTVDSEDTTEDDAAFVEPGEEDDL